MMSLKQMRLEANLKQTDALHLLKQYGRNIDVPTLSKIENGRINDAYLAEFELFSIYAGIIDLNGKYRQFSDLQVQVLNAIPYGYDNGVSYSDITDCVGSDDRVIRNSFLAIRRYHPIINTQDGKGFFRPRHGNALDISMTQRWLLQEESRAKSILWRMKGAKQFLLNE